MLKRRGQVNNVLLIVLIVFLLLIALGAFPFWSYSASWGYAPGSLATIVVIILIILLITKL